MHVSSLFEPENAKQWLLTNFSKLTSANKICFWMTSDHIMFLHAWFKITFFENGDKKRQENP